MGNRGYILNPGDENSRCLESSNCCFTTATRPSDIYLYLAQAVFLGPVSSSLGSQLSRIGGALSRPFEPGCAGTSPSNNIAFGVGNRNNSVIESRLNISLAFRNQLALSPSYSSSPFPSHILSPFLYFLVAPRLCPRPATVLRRPRLVRALVCVRCPQTGRPRRCLMPR